ncbi:hypothetical protein niasHS_004383 [Heterodera schachtii]|uniref:G_PROTEIN_RECEP_F1_2 domain-containing protein n=1 Tax=Heterodera schachtii TaxID=97005 RepID=A0ABD2K1X5_HETSC
MTSLNNNNTFYLTFKDANPSLALISCASIVGIIALLGIIFNVSVIFVTVKTKAFRDPINYLLALCFFFELLHQQGHFLFVYTAFSGQNFIQFRLATKLVFVSAFGLGGIYPTMFFTGIDRLYVVIFDEMQNKRKIQLYLATITSGTSYKTVINTCMMLITGIIYLVVGILIRTKSAGMPSADQINRRAFRALFCIITVNIGGYCIHSICNGLIRPLIQSPITTCNVNESTFDIEQRSNNASRLHSVQKWPFLVATVMAH